MGGPELLIRKHYKAHLVSEGARAAKGVLVLTVVRLVHS